MIQTSHNASQTRMVDNELSGVRAKRIVDGDGKEVLRHSRQVCNLPLGPVLAPESNAIVRACDASLSMQMHQTSAKVLPARMHRLVVLPLVCAEGFGNGVVGPVA